MKFAPLHITSGYSFLKSGLTMERIGKALKDNGYYGMGLTDLGVMYGVPEFVNSLEKQERPYIIGVDVTVNGDSLSLFALNEEGYHNLVNINTLLQKESLSSENIKPYISGLLAVIETNHGKFKSNFEELEETPFSRYLLEYASLFKDDFYLGIEVTSKEEVSYANKIRKYADKHTYPCVAFPRIKYLKKDDAIVLEIVSAIENDEKLDIKAKTGQEYFMKETDYSKIYSSIEMANTINIINKSTFNFHMKRGEILHYPCDNSIKVLTDTCEQALKDKNINDALHQDRLKYELDIIITMGYADYFLIVSDYVNYSKTHNILVGPGRGSAAGSLVSYLLNITEVDPLSFNLQFERFLNPYRKSMPDIDVDFMDIKRDQVVEYMREKYGQNKVANIVTFQTILAKQALRDIGRVYDYPTRHIDLLSKRITNHNLDLRSAYRQLGEFRSLVDSDKYFLEIVSLASKIENLPRQSGMHAAGIILNNFPLDGAIPVSIDFNNNYISQYEMGYLEEQGFLKMDFLGLRNLTTIARAVELININHKEDNLTPFNIPYDRQEIFDFISNGMNMGLFQIETAAMARSIKVLRPNCFNDLVALLALGRPGPMEYIPIYSARKENKEKVTYLCPELEPILKETYGIIVYQEQINQIATTLAGFTPGEADLFRRAISKKDKSKMNELETSFINGCLKKGKEEKTAKKVYLDILKFADYGFNKSHSVVYSIITARMAYLKVHYPLEFYASILENASSSDDTKFGEYISEMKKRNIKVYAPDINKSTNRFIIYDNGLLFPLTSISGINELLYNKIALERENNGPFKDYFDFITRMFQYKINENQIQKLVDAGALDSFYPSRKAMNMTIRSALQYAELNYDKDGQLSLGIASILPPNMIGGNDDPLDRLDKEYEAIGLMLSDNPLKYKQDLLVDKGVIKIGESKENKGKLTLCGIIKQVKVIHTKKGSSMAFIKIFDETGEEEITLFPTLFEENFSIIEKNNIVIVSGHREERNGDVSFLADTVNLLEDE